MGISEISDKTRAMAYAALDYITSNPETGFRERKTSKYMEERFLELGFKVKRAGNIPGFVCDMEFDKPGPKLALIAELDALTLPLHPEADPVTGAAHGCGHNAQCAAILAAADILRGMAHDLSGSVRFVIVPAEELIELEYRKELIKNGTIRYPGGKPEFIYRGLFDGVDASLLVHTYSYPGKCAVLIRGCDGCLTKTPVFTGRASHAGSAPDQGTNALYSATLGLRAVNAIRETFRDNDHIRVHGIISRGGASANITPDSVALESYVRAASIASLSDVNSRVNRAFAGSAAALGARLTVNDTMGYMPLANDPVISEAVKSIEGELGLPVRAALDVWDTGCTDMGDLSTLMPTVQVIMSGSEGQAHSVDFKIADRESAVLGSGLLQALTARALLSNGAAKLNEALASFKPVYKTKEEYFAARDALTGAYEAVEYSSDGNITINVKGCAK